MNNERFKIYRKGGDIQVLDTDTGYTDENLMMFGFDVEDNEEVAKYLAQELEPLVQLLNEQHNELKKRGIILP